MIQYLIALGVSLIMTLSASGKDIYLQCDGQQDVDYYQVIINNELIYTGWPAEWDGSINLPITEYADGNKHVFQLVACDQYDNCSGLSEKFKFKKDGRDYIGKQCVVRRDDGSCKFKNVQNLLWKPRPKN